VSSYGLTEVNEMTIKFFCDDEDVMKKVKDFISMVMDAENYRRQIRRVEVIE